MKRGLVQVYSSLTPEPITNFSPIGLALRAAGHKFNIHIFMFDGDNHTLQSLKILSTVLAPYIQVFPIAEDISTQALSYQFERVEKSLSSENMDIMILMGVHQLLHRGVVTTSELTGLVTKKPEYVELVFCGRNLPNQLFETADLVTQMDLVHTGDPMPEGYGPTEVITGNGKGKTTYCLGKTALVSVTGVSCFILQVIKSPSLYGEVKAIERLPNIDIRTMGKGFLNRNGKGPGEEHIKAAQEAWKLLEEVVYSRKYGMVVLDEINVATHYGLIDTESLLHLILNRPSGLQLLLSGRYADPEVMKAATTVIEMKEIKHPFRAGIKARKGIEF